MDRHQDVSKFLEVAITIEHKRIHEFSSEEDFVTCQEFKIQKINVISPLDFQSQCLTSSGRNTVTVPIVLPELSDLTVELGPRTPQQQ